MYHYLSISSLATFALLLDLVEISTEFAVVTTTQFCFAYTLQSVTTVPRGLHARLCHASVVFFDSCSFVHPFVPTDLVTTISYERLEQF